MKEQMLKKRERRSLASREGYRWLQYEVQHNHIFTAENQPQKHITKIYTSILRVTADVHLFEVKAKSFPYLLTALPKEKTNKTRQQNPSKHTDAFPIYQLQFPSYSTWGFWMTKKSWKCSWDVGNCFVIYFNHCITRVLKIAKLQ